MAEVPPGEFDGKLNIYAASFLWGTFSALSLPLGATISYFFKIPKKWNCAFLAFGSGALLFALTVEIFGSALADYQLEPPHDKAPMIMLAVGALIGSFIFSVSNYMIETQGGFLRKFALRSRFLRKEVKKRESIMRESYRRDSAQSIHSAHSPLKQRKPSGNYGAYLPVPGSRLSASVTVVEDQSNQRLEIDDGKNKFSNPVARTELLPENDSDDEEIDTQFSRDLHIEENQIEQEFKESKNDAKIGVAIWLGILIDSLPESLVIGILVVHGISFTFIAGVFVSNLPEAMSSSTIMARGGFSKLKIMLMWLSVTLITGLGAVVGTACFAGEPSAAKHLAELTVEGIAAGAMLVMIAETALPEAFRHAGNLVGFSTLFGFLTAYIIKLFEEVAEVVP